MTWGGAAFLYGSPPPNKKMEVAMNEYTATTLERARHVLKKFPLSDGAKMAIGKDLEYGYTWAALP